MSSRLLDTRRDGSIEYITLNRPDVRNAFNDDVIAQLSAWAEDLTAQGERQTVRAAILSGAGRVFCAGADVTWMSKMVGFTTEENLRDALAMSRMFAALDSLPVPLVGRIQGAALGGGCGLAAVCDIAVAAEDAVFGFTEVKLGILPAVISPFVLAKIGRSAARDLFLTGARFSAARALEVGLVHAVVPESELDGTVARYVREILTAGPEAIATAKALIRKVWTQPIEDAMTTTATAIATRRVSPEGQEGLRAFLEKRKPSWSA